MASVAHPRWIWSALPRLPLLLSLACCGAPAAGSRGAAVLAIAGRGKCGTTHLYFVLRTHPNVLALRKESCPPPSVVDFFAGELRRRAGADLGDRGAWEKACSAATRESCHGVVEKLPESGASGDLIVLVSCQKAWKSLALNQTTANTKVLFTIRDPASFLWASYNFWEHGGDEIYQPEGWATDKKGHSHGYRSPEHFHEVLLARGSLRASQDWGEGRCGCPLCPEQGRVCLGITDIQSLIASFGADDVLPLQQESLDQLATFERICRFAGLDPALLDARNVRSTTDPKSIGRHSDPAKDHTRASELGTYAISRHRAMLPESRALIYGALRPACREAQSLYQLSFPDCLGSAEGGLGSPPSAVEAPPAAPAAAALPPEEPPREEPPASPVGEVAGGWAADKEPAGELTVESLQDCTDVVSASILLACAFGCAAGYWVRGESASGIEATLEKAEGGGAADPEQMKFAPEADGDL